MWPALAPVLSAVGSALSAVFEAITENPKTALAALGVVALWLSGAYAGWWYRGPGPEGTSSRNPTEIQRSNAPLDSADFLGGSTPSVAGLFSAPDSARVETVRVRVPEQVTDTVYRDPPTPTKPTPPQDRSITLRARLRANPYGFLLLPTPDGRPSVYVSESETEIRAVDPQDASAVRLQYRHPTPHLTAGPLVQTSGTFSGGFRPEAVLGGWVQFRAFRLGAGYRFARPARSGPALSVEWSPALLQR